MQQACARIVRSKCPQDTASERPVFATDPEDAPLLSSARRLIRDRVVPCLDEPLRSWKLPPKFKPLDVS